MNNNIIVKLEQLATLYGQDSRLKFKHSAIIKALTNIRRHPHVITSGQYAQENIKNVGDGIGRRIDEILFTGTLSELPAESSKDKGKDKGQEKLLQITGIGEKRMAKLRDQCITTIPQYLKAVQMGIIKSTHHIDIGIKYMDDIGQRIPRNEIQLMEPILIRELHKLGPSMVINICGSYRRGKADCGDIDVLITCTKPDSNGNRDYLTEYVENLSAGGFLIDHLTHKGKKKYMGICKIMQTARRIDIRYVGYGAYYAALIYFTGSKNFNVEIRNRAIKLGYSLNEYGLTDKESGKLIELHSEKEIFEFLKIPYVDPCNRDI